MAGSPSLDLCEMGLMPGGCPDYVMNPNSGHVDEGTGPLVWVFLGVYLVFLLIIAAWGFAKTFGCCGQQKVAKGDGLADHFVANRSLGYVVLTLTVFATVYSGYTVVGVPGEVWSAGLFGFRWFFTPIIMFCPMSMIASRLQYLSKERNYISPVDFISDRYKSRELTTVAALVMAFPAMVYAMSQFKSMGETVEALSEGKIEAFEAASVFCVIMVAYEVFGGMRAIAWTDALQGGVLFVGFILFFIVQWELFGGIEASALKWQWWAVPKQLQAPPAPATVIPPGMTMLSKWQMESWFAFAFTLFWSFGFYPHLLLRVQAAKSAKVIKISNMVQPFGHCVVMLGSIFTGMIAYRWFPYAIPGCLSPKTNAVTPGCLSDPHAKSMIFGKVIRRAIEENLGYNILGSMMLAASVAAFMSTADSAIHATSSLITMDIFKPIFKAQYYDCKIFGLASQESVLLFIGKLSSLCVAIFALFSSKVDMSLSALLVAQGAILSQIAPAFWLGWYKTGVKAHAILLGMLAGITITFYFQCYEDDGEGYCNRHPAYSSWYGPIDGIHPGIFGFIVNVAIVLVVSMIPGKPLILCKIDGEPIPDSMLAWSADGDKRPWRTMPWCFVWWGGCLLCCFTTPWWKNDAWEEVPEPFGGVDATLYMGLPEWVWHCGAFGVAGIFCIVFSLFMGWSDEPETPAIAKAVEGETNGVEGATNEVELTTRAEGTTEAPPAYDPNGPPRSTII